MGKGKKVPQQNSVSLWLWVLGIFLFTSLFFNAYQFEKIKELKNSDIDSADRAVGARFLDLNKPVTCENKGLDLNSLPPCPVGSKPKILPSHYPIHSIFLGYQEGIEQTGFFQSTLEIVRNKKPTIPLMVMVPRDQREKAVAELDNYLSDQTKDLVRLVFSPSQYTIWAQDYFEQAVDGRTGAHYFIDLPYESQMGEHVPTALALACNSNLIGQAALDPLIEADWSGNFGGNIEALTDDLVLIGNNMSPAQKAILENEIDQKFLELDVSWLKVGHVDEIVSVLPVPSRSGKCPFDLAYASPGLALSQLKNENLEKRPGPLMLRFGFGDAQSQFNIWACQAGGPDADHPGCKTLRGSNLAYEKIIQASVVKIKNELAKYDPSCKAVKAVPLPVLFTAAREQKTYGTTKDDATAIGPNPVNNIVLGEHILIPKQGLDVFQRYTREVIRSYNLKATYLDGDYIHAFDGGIHCAMNIRRVCRP